MPTQVQQMQTAPGRILLAPLGTATPANTVAYGAAWPAGWEDQGWTQGGIGWRLSTDLQDIRVDQSPYAVDHVMTGGEVAVMASLAQSTLKRLAASVGRGVYTYVAPVTGATPADGYEQYDIPADQEVLARTMVGVETKTKEGKPRRIFLYEALAIAPQEWNVNLGQLALIRMEFRAVPPADATKPLCRRIDVLATALT